MYLEQLTPYNDFLRYIPNYLLDDEIEPSFYPSLSPFLIQKMSVFEYTGLITGLMDLQSKKLKSGKNIVKNPDSSSPDILQWFKTTEIVDVRVFFRKSNHKDGFIGSKMRLYSVGRGYLDGEGDEESIQQIDSGFLVNNSFYKPVSSVFQSALASTMLYNALYSIGGEAHVRKMNVADESNPKAPSYKTVTHIKPKFSEAVDWRRYNHILDPACYAAGMNGVDYLGSDVADAITSALFTSKDVESLKSSLSNLPGNLLYKEEVEDIIEECNSEKGNLAHTGKKDWSSEVGINIVQALKMIKEILDSAEE